MWNPDFWLPPVQGGSSRLRTYLEALPTQYIEFEIVPDFLNFRELQRY